MTVVGGLEFCWCQVVVGLEDAPVVEPVDVVQGGELDLFDLPPWSLSADEFGFEQPDDGLGERVVIGVADRSDEAVDASIEQSFGGAIEVYWLPRSL